MFDAQPRFEGRHRRWNLGRCGGRSKTRGEDHFHHAGNDLLLDLHLDRRGSNDAFVFRVDLVLLEISAKSIVKFHNDCTGVEVSEINRWVGGQSVPGWKKLDDVIRAASRNEVFFGGLSVNKPDSLVNLVMMSVMN